MCVGRLRHKKKLKCKFRFQMIAKIIRTSYLFDEQSTNDEIFTKDFCLKNKCPNLLLCYVVCWRDASGHALWYCSCCHEINNFGTLQHNFREMATTIFWQLFFTCCRVEFWLLRSASPKSKCHYSGNSFFNMKIIIS